MAFQIICLGLILAITFMHSIFGFFSGLVNLFCSILAAVAAFAFFEPLAVWASGTINIHPAYFEAGSFFLIFWAALAALRFSADNLIRGNVRMPPSVDWGGASVCGFLNAQIAVGMLALSVLMLPLGGNVMGFSRFERTEDVDSVTNMTKFARQSLWTRPDEMTVWLVKTLSSGSLRGGTPLATVYPNFIDSVHYSTNTVQWESSSVPYRDKKGDGVAKGITLESWWEQTEGVVGRYRKDAPTAEQPTPPYVEQTYRVGEGRKLVVARMQLNADSGDRDANRSVHLFRPTMLRLVGEVNGRPADATAAIVAGADERIGGRPRIADYDINFSHPESVAPVEVYFDVPADFRPRFVEYRRRARASLTSEPLATLDAGGGKRPPVPMLALLTAEERAAQANAARSERFGDKLEFPSGDVGQLPFKMNQDAVRRGGGTLEGNALVSGRVSGPRERFQSIGGQPEVELFKIPEGYRLCQVRFQPQKVRTIVGQVFNFVSRNVNQYFARDDAGDRWMMVGYFAIVRRGNAEHIEMFYTGEPPAENATFRGMLDFKSITKAEELEAEGTTIGLLFLVRSGRTVLGIENQAGQSVTGLSLRMSP